MRRYQGKNEYASADAKIPTPAHSAMPMKNPFMACRLAVSCSVFVANLIVLDLGKRKDSKKRPCFLRNKKSNDDAAITIQDQQ